MADDARVAGAWRGASEALSALLLGILVLGLLGIGGCMMYGWGTATSTTGTTKPITIILRTDTKDKDKKGDEGSTNDHLKISESARDRLYED